MFSFLFLFAYIIFLLSFFWFRMCVYCFAFLRICLSCFRKTFVAIRSNGVTELNANFSVCCWTWNFEFRNILIFHHHQLTVNNYFRHRLHPRSTKCAAVKCFFRFFFLVKKNHNVYCQSYKNTLMREIETRTRTHSLEIWAVDLVANFEWSIKLFGNIIVV